MANITKNIGNIGSFLPGNIASNIPKNVGGLDFSKFINNVPTESIKGSDSNLKDLITSQQGGVIKKILKSNYAKLVK